MKHLSFVEVYKGFEVTTDGELFYWENGDSLGFFFLDNLHMDIELYLREDY